MGGTGLPAGAEAVLPFQGRTALVTAGAIPGARSLPPEWTPSRDAAAATGSYLVVAYAVDIE